MKTISLLLLLLTFACASKKATIGQNPKLTSECPINGNCSVKIIRNASLVITNDEFGNHYKTIEDAEKSVVIYTYSKIVKGNLQDAGYREEIVFELSNSLSATTFTDAKIQQTKMLFGRFCYCKGQTGYYKVDSGTLQINANSRTADLDFTITEVPQIIKKISISLK